MSDPNRNDHYSTPTYMRRPIVARILRAGIPADLANTLAHFEVEDILAGRQVYGSWDCTHVDDVERGEEHE